MNGQSSSMPVLRHSTASAVRVHVFALAAFAGMTALWLLPLVTHFETHLVGGGAGDNVTFLWDLWWMRYSLNHHGVSFFQTAFLLFPFGANLTLHTHTALPSFLAALAGPQSLIAAQNLIVVGHLYLNFVCAYALAFQITKRFTAAFLGAIVFGWSPFMSAHLVGHFNLIAGWVLPLAVSLMLMARRTNRAFARAALGAAIAATAYVDYYLFIFVAAITALAVGQSFVRLSILPNVRTRFRTRLSMAIVSVVLVEAAFIAIVRLLRADVLYVAGARVTIRELHNPITLGWVMLVASAVIRWWPRVTAHIRPAGERIHVVVVLAAAATALVALVPVLLGASALWRAGDYATQHYRPRSAPGGVDALTFVLGNPFSALWGDRVLTWYQKLGINPVEGGAWLPLCAVALAYAGSFSERTDTTRFWKITGGLFVLWSLGPWLLAMGIQTPILLPQFAARYIPIVSNARIPGRGMIAAYLALAVLAPLGFSRLASQGGRRRTAAWVLAAGCILELIPSRPAIYEPAVPSVYASIKNAAGVGAVCELPLGLRDGFGEVGTFDEQVLVNQTFYERPLVGGFLARLPPSTASKYRRLPVLGKLLRLSGDSFRGDVAPDVSATDAAQQLASLGVRFLVLNRDLASAELSAFVQHGIALRELGRDEHRTVYEVDSDTATWNGASGVAARRAAKPTEQIPNEARVSVRTIFRQVAGGNQQPRP